MSEQEQTSFNGWAKVEVMGRQSHIGLCQTQAFGGAVLFRIDRPEIPEEEVTLTESGWVGNTRAPVGTVVKRAAIPAASVLVGAASIYRIIPCDEATAIQAIKSNVNRPLLIVKLADAPALAAGDAPTVIVDTYELRDDDDDEVGEDGPL